MSDALYYGHNTTTSATSEFNQHAFQTDEFTQMLSHSMLVLVKKFTPFGQQDGGSGGGGSGGGGSSGSSGGQGGKVAPIGMVAVQPMINMVDGSGNPTQHGVVHNLPYFRLQSGNQAIIMDPQPGDICLAVFGDRDSSVVKKTYQPANPGSKRSNDMADGMCFGVLLSNKAPQNYLQFDNNGGINLVCTGTLTLQAKSVVIKSSDIKLGDTDADKPLGMLNSVDSGGDKLVSALSTTTKTK